MPIDCRYLYIIKYIIWFLLDDQESACRDILGLVHHCPTVMDLELDKLVEECFKVVITLICNIKHYILKTQKYIIYKEKL